MMGQGTDRVCASGAVFYFDVEMQLPTYKAAVPESEHPPLVSIDRCTEYLGGNVGPVDPAQSNIFNNETFFHSKTLFHLR